KRLASATTAEAQLPAFFSGAAATGVKLPFGRCLIVQAGSPLAITSWRALCAEYASVLVRVEKRRGDELYINDGAYGALFDAAHIGWRYPVRLIRGEESRTRPMAFSFYGPTCDDLDRMAGPFELPGDVAAGDYIEIGVLGAYGC